MNSCCTWKLVLGIFIGMALAVGIFCLTVAIGCAVNGISFGQQIIDWFGTKTVEDVENSKNVVEAVANIVRL